MPLTTTSYGAYKYAELAAATDFPAQDSPSIDFDFTTTHVKLQAVGTGADIEISYDGSTTHAKILEDDGIQDYPGVAVGKLWIKGTGTLRVTAW